MARVIPILKPNKDSNECDSFRPISNVNLIEKVVEHVLREQIQEYLDTENIIPDNHHGGRPGFSTITAKAQLEEITSDKVETKEIVATLTTDLTAAFDLIDHTILVEKLRIIGFDENACILMASFSEKQKTVCRDSGVPVRDSPTRQLQRPSGDKEERDAL